MLLQLRRTIASWVDQADAQGAGSMLPMLGHPSRGYSLRIVGAMLAHQRLFPAMRGRCAGCL